MSKLRVESFSMSIDGFSAGPDQSLENPMGIGGQALHEWAFPTATIQPYLSGSDRRATHSDCTDPAGLRGEVIRGY